MMHWYNQVIKVNPLLIEQKFQKYYHFQIFGINFGLDVISEKLPLVIKK